MKKNHPAPTYKNLLFVFLLLASGFCGISYEILYGRILGNLIGDQFAVTASILLTFLLGMGFGTLYAHRLWKHLWLVELAIGICGVAFALGTKVLDSLLYAAGGVVGHGLGGSVMMCLLLLSAPSFLIGCSLPLFAGYLSRLDTGRVFSKAYTIYNVGAAVTALLIEFWLLREMGIRGTVIVIASINAVVAVWLRLGFRELSEAVPPPSERVRFPSHHLAALAMVSVASAVFQLLMVKLAECLMGPFRETFALVLATVFLGLAVGAALTARWRIGFAVLLVVNLVGLAWLVGGFGWLARLYAGMYPVASEGYLSSVLLKLMVIILAMGAPAVTFGATIPALLQEQKNVARESGQLLFVSSVANALGFLLMAFALHRFFDYGVLLALIASLVCLSAMTFWKFRLAGTATAFAVLLAIVGLQRTVWDENLLFLGHTAFHSREELTEKRAKMLFPDKFKGYQDTFSINWVGGRPYFFINGYISFRLDSPYEKLVGAYASLYAPRTDKALVLGLGSGATGGTVGLLFDRVDAVELNPIVIENLYRMKEWNFDIQSKRHVNIIVDDAIHYTKASQEKYSLIINTVTTPLYFSASKLYTRDFFDAVRERLAPDGVYMTWVDSRVGDAGLNIILKTLSQTFNECSIGCIQSTYFLFICSQQPMAVHNARAVAEHPLLQEIFWKDNGLRTEWIPYGLVTMRAYGLVKDITAPVNTMDYPALEFEVARLRKRGIEDFKKRLTDYLNVEEVETALKPVMKFDPIEFALYNEELHGPSAVSRRWKKLIGGSDPDFERRFELAKARYHADQAVVANTANAHHDAGMRLIRAGMDREAIEAFKKALAINPKRNNTHFNIGSCYERLGRFNEAVEYYLNELTADPQDKDVAFRVGRVLFKQQRYQEALASLNTAVSVNPDAETYCIRGLTFEAMGATEDASRDLERARSMKLDVDAVRRTLGKSP